MEFQAVGWHTQGPCGLTEPCACRELTPPAQLELKGEKQDCSGQQGLEYPAEELGPCPKEQKMLVIRQDLAPNSRPVKTQVGWGETTYDPPRGRAIVRVPELRPCSAGLQGGKGWQPIPIQPPLSPGVQTLQTPPR